MKGMFIVSLVIILLAIANPAAAQSIEFVSSTLWTGARSVQIVDDYAYCNFQNGLVILDMFDPISPSFVSKFPLGGDNRKMSVQGNYAYIANGNLGLQIIDVTYAESPTLISSYVSLYSAKDVALKDNYAYVTVQWVDDITGDSYNKVLVLDISDPYNPFYVDEFNVYYSLPITNVFVTDSLAVVAYSGTRLIEEYDIPFGGLAIFDITESSSPELIGNNLIYESGYKKVFVSGSHAYVAYGNNGLHIYDLSYPSVPFFEGTYETSGHAYDVIIDGDYAYVADGSSGLQVLNVSDPSNPTPEGNFSSENSVGNIFISDGYAYVAHIYSGIKIISITNPEYPFLAGSFDTPNSVHNVFAAENYAYVSQVFSGFQIVDIIDPENPVLSGNFNDSCRTYNVFTSGNYAYLADYDLGMQILNITDPEHPILTGSFSTSGYGYGYEVFTSGDYAYLVSGVGLLSINITNPEYPVLADSLVLQGNTQGIFIQGNYAYLANDYPDFRIIDISDPENLVLVETMLLPGSGRKVFVSGDYAYLAAGWGGDFHVIDISDPENPSLTGTLNIPGTSVGDVFVQGNYAYVTAGGLKIIDVSNPANPMLSASYYTPNSASSVSGSGNYVYVADGTSLMILYFDSESAGSTYEYLPGDVNMLNGIWPPSVIGGDVTYLVNFFKGSEVNIPCNLNNVNAPTPPGQYFWASADPNGDCLILGSDVVRLVNYFRGSSEIGYCTEYEPAWQALDDTPAEMPEGWPNCE